jgi:hypothetical protein
MKTHRKPTMRSLRIVLLAAASVLSLATVASAADYPSTVLANNPSAYYRLEETSGSVAHDSSVNGVNAAYNFSTTGSPQLGQPGIDTNSISFNGGGADYGYVDIPSSALIAPVGANGTNSGPFSAELWVQATSQPASWTVPIEVAQYPNGWNIYVSGADAGNGATSYFYLVMRPPIFNAAVDFPIQFLRWYHLVLTFDGTNALFYVNGVSHGPYNASGFVPALTSDAHIGSGQGVGWQPLNGGVDEVAFYTNVLTAAQVQNHYQVGTNSFRQVPTPPLILADPASQSVYSGLPVSFTVSASGTLPLHYKWLKNGAPAGPDATPYGFTAQYPADNNATIQVIVTNNYGSKTSAVATLTVLTNVNIVGSPGSITRNVGSYAAFHVIANGAVPISYQWSNSTDGLNFTAIPGGTNATLWLSNVQMTANGDTYAVKVSNPFQSASALASLAVQARPVNVPLTGYAQIISADHPVAYWRLDETNGSTTAVDAVGTFDGTYTPGAGSFTYQVPTGIPHWTNDPAVELAGGATVQIPFAPELNPDTTWSAETWFKPSSLGANGGDYRVLLSSQYNLFPNPYNGWYIYQQPNNTIAFVPQPGNGFIVAGPDDPANNNQLVANNWYYLAVTDDGANFNVYINGKLRTGFPVSGIPFIANGTGINLDGTPGIGSGLGNTVLGRRTDGAFNAFLGTMDETAFYNYALTPAQVQAHYAGSVWLTITKTGPTSVSLTWPVGTLQSASLAAGPYADVSGASSPYPHPSTGAPTFYRVRLHNP